MTLELGEVFWECMTETLRVVAFFTASKLVVTSFISQFHVFSSEADQIGGLMELLATK